MKHYLIRRIPKLAAITIVIAGAVCAIWPIQARPHRALMVAGLLTAWLWCITALWQGQRRVAACAVAALGACVALLCCAPGRDYDREQLRAHYAAALQRYDGTRYVWGGETRLGIDCSGLVREGLVHACLRQGVATLNPRLVRAAMALWWYDCTARGLLDGYRGFAMPICAATSLNAVKPDDCVSGRMAVTDSGIHVLACIASNRWIQADPGEGKVVCVSLPSSNGWCNTPVRLLRWSML